ncbi:MAG: hypothetical protein ACN4GZ_02485 [Acidimicrobiales bacterium]
MSDPERGSILLPGVVGIAMMFFAFVLITQFAVWQYGRGAVQSAANDAARSAAAFGAAPGTCEAVFDAARGDLLGGSLGKGVGAPRCSVGGEFAEVVVPVTFGKWLPISPDWNFEVRATAAVERLPEP